MDKEEKDINCIHNLKKLKKNELIRIIKNILEREPIYQRIIYNEFNEEYEDKIIEAVKNNDEEFLNENFDEEGLSFSSDYFIENISYSICNYIKDSTKMVGIMTRRSISDKLYGKCALLYLLNDLYIPQNLRYNNGFSSICNAMKCKDFSDYLKTAEPKKISEFIINFSDYVDVILFNGFLANGKNKQTYLDIETSEMASFYSDFISVLEYFKSEGNTLFVANLKSEFAPKFNDFLMKNEILELDDDGNFKLTEDEDKLSSFELLLKLQRK